MKLRIISDLHFDVNRIKPDVKDWFNEKADYTLIAGDISGDIESCDKCLRMLFPEDKVVFIEGNHICYHKGCQGISLLKRQYKDRFNGQYQFLDNGIFELSPNVILVGATFYTDYLYGGDEASRNFNMMCGERGLNDFHWGREDGPLLASHYLDWHKQSKLFFKNMADAHKDKLVIFMTHHGMHPALLDEDYVYSDVNASYISDLRKWLEPMKNVKYCLSGHIHKHKDFEDGHIRFVQNPLGYMCYEQNQGFIPDLILEV